MKSLTKRETHWLLDDLERLQADLTAARRSCDKPTTGQIQVVRSAIGRLLDTLPAPDEPVSPAPKPSG